MLIDTDKYSQSLKKLWSEVFGDSEEYISLIFDNGYIPAEVFGEISDGEVVSALYLLKCKIDAGDVSFNGRYLYAAATHPDYRKQGIMAKLIDEAKQYAVSENIAFIALVPASEELYGYYGKFGFEALMYNYGSTVLRDGKISVPDEKIEDAECLLKLRNGYKGDRFTFETPEMTYALSCLNFAGYNAYRNSDDSYYISDENRTEVIEYISSNENFWENTELFLSKLGSGTVISSPYDLSEFCESKMQKNGMVYTIQNALKENAVSGIYMNIALD